MLHKLKPWRRLAVGAVFVAALIGAAAVPAYAAGTHTASPQVSPQIVGGTPAPSYSAVASLQLTYDGDPNFHWCGGTLIDAWDVQTNAHCVTNEPAPGSAQRAAANLRFSSWLAARPTSSSINFNDPTIWHLRIGSNDRLHGGVVRGVRKITVFPTWAWGTPDNKGRIGDIAILRLDRPVTTLAPAVITNADPASPVRAVGWGMTTQPTEWSGPAPEMLSQIDLPLVAAGDCDGASIGSWELCVGVPEHGGGACNGDSGSPALRESLAGQWTEVVGSTSRGADDGVSCGQTPVVYTDVYAYRTWIRIAELGQGSGGPTA